MGKAKPKWQLIGDYPVTDYKCGARAGDRVRLRRDIVIEQGGKPTGKVLRAGEIWSVISGSAVPPLDVWLRDPNGERHTWDDDADFWTWFERVNENAV